MQPFYLQEYNEILAKRTQQLQNIRHQPAQFTVLVREIPLCSEHKTSGCSVDHFFSKHYPYAYHSYQMLYDATDLEQLLVRIYWARIRWYPNICIRVSLLLCENYFYGFTLLKLFPCTCILCHFHRQKYIGKKLKNV